MGSWCIVSGSFFYVFGSMFGYVFGDVSAAPSWSMDLPRSLVNCSPSSVMHLGPRGGVRRLGRCWALNVWPVVCASC